MVVTMVVENRRPACARAPVMSPRRLSMSGRALGETIDPVLR
jgi:hypothetical protein